MSHSILKLKEKHGILQTNKKPNVPSVTDKLELETIEMEYRLSKLKADMAIEKEIRDAKLAKNKGNIWKKAADTKNANYIDKLMDDIQRKEIEMKKRKATIKPNNNAKPNTLSSSNNENLPQKQLFAAYAAEKHVQLVYEEQNTSNSLWGKFDESDSHNSFLAAREQWKNGGGIEGTTSTTSTIVKKTSSSLLDGSFDESGGQESFKEARLQWLSANSAKKEPKEIDVKIAPQFIDKTNSLLYGEFDEQGGKDSFQEARTLWLKEASKEKLKQATIDTGSWNVFASQVSDNSDLFNSTPRAATSSRLSCYNCYKIFLSEAGINDSFSSKSFCTSKCLDIFISTSKIPCKNCKKLFLRKDGIKEKNSIYCTLPCSKGELPFQASSIPPNLFHDKSKTSLNINPSTELDKVEVIGSPLNIKKVSTGPIVEEPDD